jgi:hypothetical protein
MATDYRSLGVFRRPRLIFIAYAVAFLRSYLLRDARGSSRDAAGVRPRDGLLLDLLVS